MRTARDLKATPRPGRAPETTSFYTYRGAKTEARARHFAALERHSAECLQRSQEVAEAPAPAPVPAPPKPKPKPARPALPPPLYGGPEGLEMAAQEAAAFDRKAPKSEWPELPTPPTPEGEARHEITHTDTSPLPEKDTGPAGCPERHNAPLRSGKGRVGRLLGWASESIHAGARAFRDARAEGSQGRSPGGMDRSREPARH